jgi:hypothetical protein
MDAVFHELSLLVCGSAIEDLYAPLLTIHLLDSLLSLPNPVLRITATLLRLWTRSDVGIGNKRTPA